MFRLMHARAALANPLMDRALAVRVIEKAASKNGAAVTAFVRGLPDAIIDLDFLKLLAQSKWVESETNALGLSDEFFVSRAVKFIDVDGLPAKWVVKLLG
jgi:hypothetical protein